MVTWRRGSCLWLFTLADMSVIPPFLEHGITVFSSSNVCAVLLALYSKIWWRGRGTGVGPLFLSTLNCCRKAPLANYIKEVVRLRKELSATIYSGEFLDNLEASISGSGETGYCVFRDPRSNKRAAVIVNYERTTRDVTVTKFEGNNSGAVTVYQLFTPTRHARLPISLRLDGERLAVVVEE